MYRIWQWFPSMHVLRCSPRLCVSIITFYNFLNVNHSVEYLCGDTNADTHMCPAPNTHTQQNHQRSTTRRWQLDVGRYICRYNILYGVSQYHMCVCRQFPVTESTIAPQRWHSMAMTWSERKRVTGSCWLGVGWGEQLLAEEFPIFPARVLNWRRAKNKRIYFQSDKMCGIGILNFPVLSWRMKTSNQSCAIFGPHARVHTRSTCDSGAPI